MSNLVQDIHICGICKHCYATIDEFIDHKKSQCSFANQGESVQDASCTIDENNVPCKDAIYVSEKDANFLLSFSNNPAQFSADLQAMSVSHQNTTQMWENEANTESRLDNGTGKTSSSLSSEMLVPFEENNFSQKTKSKKPKKKLCCDVSDCHFSSFFMFDLTRHKRKHSGEKPFSCKFCDKSYSRSDKLTLHVRSHSSTSLFKCDACSYTSNNKNSLKLHLRIHSGEKPYRCQICTYAARTSSQLNVHLRTHTGDSPYKCDICSAKFKIKSDMQRHKNIHKDQKPFSCHVCNYRCYFKSNLVSHMNHRHEEKQSNVSQKDVTNLSEGVKIAQGDSHRKISNPKSPMKHSKKSDSRTAHVTCNRKFACPFCDDSFVRKESFQCHLRHFHHQPYISSFSTDVMETPQSKINCTTDTTTPPAGINIELYEIVTMPTHSITSCDSGSGGNFICRDNPLPPQSTTVTHEKNTKSGSITRTLSSGQFVTLDGTNSDGVNSSQLEELVTAPQKVILQRDDLNVGIVPHLNVENLPSNGYNSPQNANFNSEISNFLCGNSSSCENTK